MDHRRAPFPTSFSGTERRRHVRLQFRALRVIRGFFREEKMERKQHPITKKKTNQNFSTTVENETGPCLARLGQQARPPDFRAPPARRRATRRRTRKRRDDNSGSRLRRRGGGRAQARRRGPPRALGCLGRRADPGRRVSAAALARPQAPPRPRRRILRSFFQIGFYRDGLPGDAPAAGGARAAASPSSKPAAAALFTLFE